MTARPSSAKFLEQDPYFYDSNEPPNWKILFGNHSPIKLEIGFGMGDFLIEVATKEVHSNFIGIDFSQDGCLKLLARIKSLNLKNIRIIYGDAKNKIPALFNDGELDTFYINFPDPWPRKRHIKRRLISSDFVKLIAQKVAIKGRIHLATDSTNYAQRILEYFNAEPLLQNINQESGFLKNRENLPRTKYEKSFIYADEKIHYLEYFRLSFPEESKNSFKKNYLTNKETSQLQVSTAKADTKDISLEEKFKNEETKAKDTCDLKKVADNLVAAGQKEWARKVYKKAEDKAEDTLDYNWIAYSIFETLGDNQWVKILYKKAENKAETSLEFNWLAYSIFETLGDNEWVKTLFKKAENSPDNVRELCDLADSISETLGDKKWSREVCKKAEDRAEEYSDFYELADIMLKKIGDKQKAIELYRKSEDKAEDSSDLHSLAECFYEKLGDKKSAKKIYIKAENKAKDSVDFCCLAESLLKNLGDEEWAIKLYKKGESEAKESYEFLDLADSLCKKLGNIEWAKKLYKKSEDKAEACYEFLWLAECLCENLGDKEWAKQVYKKSVGKAKGPSKD